MQHVTRWKQVLVMLFAGLIAALSTVGIVQAQGQLEALEREFMQIQQRLVEAEQRAFANNPGLEQQADAIEELVRSKMRAAGYDPDRIAGILRETQEQLQDPNLSDAQRQAILQAPEVVDVQEQMQSAQQAVMGDGEVMQKQQALEADILASMRREEPETDRLLQRMEQIREQAMQQQGQR